MLTGTNIMVLDLETARSADDCRYCWQTQDDCVRGYPHGGDTHVFERIGWERKVDLGLSIGCYYDYRDERLAWFDRYTLIPTLAAWVQRQPLLVSFNGRQFDGPLLCALLLETPPGLDASCTATAHVLGDAFTALMARGYDVLAAVWQADPTRKFERGLNSLGTLSVANGLGTKEMDGAMAPRLWAQGRYAEVLNYCASDVYKTKGLFELIVTHGSILRGDGLPLTLPRPPLPLHEEGH